MPRCRANRSMRTDPSDPTSHGRLDDWEATTMVRRVVVAWAVVLAFAASAYAQSGSSGTSTGQTSSTSQSSTSPTANDTRPATTTFFGDTGLWFVPTAEILPDGKWSVSGYRRGTNYIQGYSNVSDFAVT